MVNEGFLQLAEGRLMPVAGGSMGGGCPSGLHQNPGSLLETNELNQRNNNVLVGTQISWLGNQKNLTTLN